MEHFIGYSFTSNELEFAYHLWYFLVEQGEKIFVQINREERYQERPVLPRSRLSFYLLHAKVRGFRWKRSCERKRLGPWDGKKNNFLFKFSGPNLLETRVAAEKITSFRVPFVVGVYLTFKWKGSGCS